MKQVLTIPLNPQQKEIEREKKKNGEIGKIRTDWCHNQSMGLRLEAAEVRGEKERNERESERILIQIKQDCHLFTAGLEMEEKRGEE